jgi:hypothetical protein
MRRRATVPPPLTDPSEVWDLWDRIGGERWAPGKPALEHVISLAPIESRICCLSGKRATECWGKVLGALAGTSRMAQPCALDGWGVTGSHPGGRRLESG